MPTPATGQWTSPRAPLIGERSSRWKSTADQLAVFMMAGPWDLAAPALIVEEAGEDSQISTEDMI